MTQLDKNDRPSIQYTYKSGNPLVLTNPHHVTFELKDGNGTRVVLYTWYSAGGGDAQITNPSTGLFNVDYAFTTLGYFKAEYTAYDSSSSPYDGTVEWYRVV